MAKTKFYTVWEGRKKGIFDSWDECRKQVEGFEGAKYKSFPSETAAKEALKKNYWEFVGKNAKTPSVLPSEVILDSLCVDAACSGNPGLMEYRGVFTRTGQEVFHQGAFEDGTNNIGEFLALVHGLALLKQQNKTIPLYSDSAIAISWVKAKKCKTKLAETAKNKDIFDLIARAEKWLQENTYTTTIRKWKTQEWGEILADFGRK